jgi:hypothetical protein
MQVFLHITWMAEGCKRIFKNMIEWGHIIGTTKAKIGQESKDFHIEEWWIVHNGPSQ